MVQYFITNWMPLVYWTIILYMARQLSCRVMYKIMAQMASKYSSNDNFIKYAFWVYGLFVKWTPRSKKICPGHHTTSMMKPNALTTDTVTMPTCTRVVNAIQPITSILHPRHLQLQSLFFSLSTALSCVTGEFIEVCERPVSVTVQWPHKQRPLRDGVHTFLYKCNNDFDLNLDSCNNH